MRFIRLVIISLFLYAVYEWTPVLVAATSFVLFMAYGLVSMEIEYRKWCKYGTIGALDEH